MGEEEFRKIARARQALDAHVAILGPIWGQACKNLALAIDQWSKSPETKAAMARLRAGIANLRYPPR